MRVLFDNGTPNPIARSLVDHEVAFARQIGWHELKDGELLRRAEVVASFFGIVKSPLWYWAINSGRMSGSILTVS